MRTTVSVTRTQPSRRELQLKALVHSAHLIREHARAFESSVALEDQRFGKELKRVARGLEYRLQRLVRDPHTKPEDLKP